MSLIAGISEHGACDDHLLVFTGNDRYHLEYRSSIMYKLAFSCNSTTKICSCLDHLTASHDIRSLAQQIQTTTGACSPNSSARPSKLSCLHEDI